ncbi:LuxR C-terminal-related transcriptional regulator [Nocardioides sp. CN2-186]|uniref:helix-turn-helix transcriptional regulator n=1 Tax=Nocardioides tweenelious TaxID=3156607 RepID=UPI0032B57DB0
MSVTTPPVTASSRFDGDQVELLDRSVFSEIAVGNWPGASAAAEDYLVVAETTGRTETVARAEAAAGIVAAVQGDADAARALLDRSERIATRRGVSGLLDLVQLGRGVEALSAGRYDEAWAQLRQLVDTVATSSGWIRSAAESYLAEAALHCGAESASATTFELARDACPVDRVFDRARINLAWGVCLRRERRVSDSRAPLLEALVAFERLGATAWADQARGELRATGERRVRRDLGDAETLTAQELQIVQMAAQGLSNREIGQRLFLSHRTIGSHLYRAFPKLGVAARSQLRDVLDGSTYLRR